MVSEPSVEDTISILRGLKEKYEVHHGVRILDSAIIEAAKLSDRYITDRFLPDKAIDLIDEAASSLRIEIDSMPAEIDSMMRQKIQLEIEREALKKRSRCLPGSNKCILMEVEPFSFCSNRPPKRIGKAKASTSTGCLNAMWTP